MHEDFTLIQKNGKPYLRMTVLDTVKDMMIYKADSEKPYVRFAGLYFTLDDEMVAALHSGTYTLR